MPKNILSFDIEDWFHPEIFDGRFPLEHWIRLESRVEQNTEIILEFLKRKNMTATFFVLGWVAEKYPELIRSIAREGHEIGSHLFSHKMITKMTPDQFQQELERSLQVLRELTQQPVMGFRAPTFSITRKTLWAFPIMYRAGIRYDSSVFPIVHDRYGIPDSPRKPYIIYKDEHSRGGIVEFPMTTVRFGTVNFPLGGGGYFRLYPFWFSRFLMKRCQAEGVPIIFYAHPWEFDKNLPRVDLNFVGKIRHYTGIKKFLERLDRLTDTFEFTSFEKSGMLNAYSLSQ